METNSKETNDPIQVLKPQLNVDSVIKKITQDGCQKDPFYICDVNEIIRKHEAWKTAMPRVEPHYAVKCNESRVVLETLTALGAGFDCASKDEIERIISLGAHPSRIIYANPTKKIDHLQYAAKHGVTMMTFDNECELQKIKATYPNAELVLRIKYDDLSARYILGQKFGCHHETEAPELLQLAARLSLNVIGVCFHIGSNSKDPSIYKNAIAAARQVFDSAATVGFNLKLLDIGGGFPGGKKKPIKEIGDIINPALEKYFPDLSIRVISEPGRYYVNTAFTLASCIHSIKTSIQIDPKTKKEANIRMYYMDVGIFGGLIPVLFDEFYATKPLHLDPNGKLCPSIIWGPTCHSYDKISDGVVMLPEMKVGDWMVLDEAGAYTLSIACEFNGFPAPRIHSVINEDGWLKLTEEAPYPLAKDKFVINYTSDNFKIGLSGPNKFKTNYF